MTTRKAGLSKSRIAAFEQCAKRLWLGTYRRELAEEDPGARVRFAVGNEVGRIARDLSVGGILVDAQPDLVAALAQTSQLLADGHRAPIYEATFQHDGILIQADVIEPLEDGSWHLAEVKSSGSAKDTQISDVATQVWIMREAGLPLASAAVRHIDSSFVLSAPGDYRGLLKDTDVTLWIQPLIARRPEIVERARAVLGGPEPDRDMGSHCDEPYACEFKSYCRRNQLEGPKWPISMLPNTGKRLASEWAGEGIEDLLELEEADLLNPLHQRIHRATKSGQPFHDVDAINHAVAGWQYPLHFLDFETIGPAIPRWIGTRPFQQVPFQFSCHTETTSGELLHAEYLSTDGSDPRRALAEALVGTLLHEEARAGTIVAYNASFERGCVRALAEAFPDLATALRDIEGRIVDLLPITRKHFYHPDQRGSWSIKRVIAALLPAMSYAELEVGDGLAAQLAWLDIVDPNTTAERRQTLQDALRTYCERDTLAMVELLRRLRSGAEARGEN
jgi:hypothetical protein